MIVVTKRDLKACRRAIRQKRADQALYQRAADNSPSDSVRSRNQQRADWARDTADTYQRWLEENR